MEDPDQAFRLFNLPEIVLEKILGYLSYEELAHLRIVCRRFNQINQSLLNKGFRRVEQYQAQCLKKVKSQLPRRESERRHHPLHGHCDILTAIETRLSLLNMTFIKYVDCQMCCFIPGKVIDEIYRVLRFVESNKTLPKPHEILQELRDISSMAMEHFEEKIIKTLKTKPVSPSSQRFSISSSMPFSSLSSELSPFTTGCSAAGPSSAGPSLNKSHVSSQYLISSNKNVASLKKEISDLKSKLHDIRRKVNDQERVALEQNRIISEQTTKLIGQEAKQNEMSRKLLAFEQRFTELYAEVGRLKDDSKAGPSSSGLNWQPNNDSGKYFVSHTVTSTPALGSLFVTGSVMQPNLVPLNLAAAQMSPSPYLTSSQLGAFSPSSLAFSVDPGSHASTSSAIYSTSPLNPSSVLSESNPHEFTPSTSSQNTGERDNSEETNMEMRPPKAPLKKRTKRKLRTASEADLDSLFKKNRIEK